MRLLFGLVNNTKPMKHPGTLSNAKTRAMTQEFKYRRAVAFRPGRSQPPRLTLVHNKNRAISFVSQPCTKSK
jgi:hypothetical protein